MTTLTTTAPLAFTVTLTHFSGLVETLTFADEYDACEVVQEYLTANYGIRENDEGYGQDMWELTEEHFQAPQMQEAFTITDTNGVVLYKG